MGRIYYKFSKLIVVWERRKINETKGPRYNHYILLICIFKAKNVKWIC